MNYNNKFKLDFPEKDHKLFLKTMNDDYKLLKKIKFDNKNELKSKQVIYSNEEWKFDNITSNLTHNFLMDVNNFTDWDNWSNLITNVHARLNRKENMQLKKLCNK